MSTWTKVLRLVNHSGAAAGLFRPLLAKESKICGGGKQMTNNPFLKILLKAVNHWCVRLLKQLCKSPTISCLQLWKHEHMHNAKGHLRLMLGLSSLKLSNNATFYPLNLFLVWIKSAAVSGSSLMMAGSVFKHRRNSTFYNEMHEHEHSGWFTFLSFSCLSLVKKLDKLLHLFPSPHIDYFPTNICLTLYASFL